MPEFLASWLEKFKDIPPWLAALGLTGQILFMSRFYVQWLASERAGRSVVPVSFWWLSLGGSTLLLAYGILRPEPVIIVGQVGGFIYLRNLMLIRREQRRRRMSVPDPPAPEEPPA